MHYQRLALAASLAILLSACATAPAAMDPLPGATPEGEIAAIVATAHEGEIQQGQAAAGRATSEDVRAFAQMLVTDHTAALNNARDTFNRAGINSADNNIATTLRANSQTTVTNLGTYSGAAFDRVFMQFQVDQHAWLLDALDTALIPSARTPELRTLLQAQRASVANHLERARQIHGGLR
jgi:putative membrane protein